MNENRFFTWIWRFNGVVIAITVTLILFVILWQLTRDLRRTYFPERTTEVINVVPASPSVDATPRPVEENARFGPPHEATAFGVYAVPKFVKQTYTNRGISKESGGNRVNFLIVNTADQSTRWLFEGTSRLITDVRPMWFRPAGGQQVLLGTLLQVIEADSTGENQLSRRDDGTLYVVGPDWGPPIALNGSVRSILSVRTLDTATFEVMHSGKNGTKLRRFLMPDAPQVFEIDLPPQE